MSVLRALEQGREGASPVYGEQLRVVFRHFPRPEHPHARAAAEAAAAQSESFFWQTHDWLFEHQQTRGVDATPTFFVNGLKHEGPDTYDDLRAAIEGPLAQGDAPLGGPVDEASRVSVQRLAWLSRPYQGSGWDDASA